MTGLKKYLIRFIYLNDDKWVKLGNVFDTFDNAYLCYLGVKHIGTNNVFVFFANRMLGIKES